MTQHYLAVLQYVLLTDHPLTTSLCSCYCISQRPPEATDERNSTRHSSSKTFQQSGKHSTLGHSSDNISHELKDSVFTSLEALFFFFKFADLETVSSLYQQTVECLQCSAASKLAEDISEPNRWWHRVCWTNKFTVK